MNEKNNLQDAILNECKQDRIMVEMFLMNGVRMPGCVMDFDEDVVAFWSEGKQRMVYKHAISTIIPEKPLKAIKR